MNNEYLITSTEIRDLWIDICSTALKNDKVIVLNVEEKHDNKNYNFIIKYIVGHEINPRTQPLTIPKTATKEAVAKAFAIMKKKAVEGKLLTPDTTRLSARGPVSVYNKSKQEIIGISNNRNDRL